MMSLLPSALGAAAFFSPPPQPAKSMEPANTQAIATILVFFNMDENLLDFPAPLSGCSAYRVGFGSCSAAASPTIFILKFNINFTNMQGDSEILCIFFSVFKCGVVYSACDIRLTINNIINNKSAYKNRAHLVWVYPSYLRSRPLLRRKT